MAKYLCGKPECNGRSVTEDGADRQGLVSSKRGVRFIENNKYRPFFLYLAHTMPHVPLFAGEKFRGSSRQGVLGDVIQEIDASVGAMLDALSRHGLEKDTLVLFTSDNGPC